MVKEEVKDNSFGVAGVILGIISVVLSSAPGILLGIIGLVFSFKQKKIAKNKWALAGTILNIIGIVIGLAIFIFALNAILNNPNFISQFQQLRTQ